jgi:hypothetical protein
MKKTQPSPPSRELLSSEEYLESLRVRADETDLFWLEAGENLKLDIDELEATGFSPDECQALRKQNETAKAELADGPARRQASDAAFGQHVAPLWEEFKEKLRQCYGDVSENE